MKQFLIIAQIIIPIILVTLILLQQRGTALGSAFGQEGGVYSTRRGVQKKLLWATIFCGILFIVLTLLNLLIP